MNKTPYILGAHHQLICDALDNVVRGKTKKLIINIAPRYGKTLLVSQMFIGYGFAINPQAKFLHLSYSGGLTQENSMAVKDMLTSEYYQSLFEARIRDGQNTRAKWSTVQGGGEYATSTLGQITGFGAGRVDTTQEEKDMDEFTAMFNPDKFSGAIVIDDPIKPEDALSDNIRESVNRRFETTIRNRVNSRKTPIIVIMQRLHEHDLCGYLQEIEPDEWTILSIPCIQYQDGKESALWPFKHSLEELHRLEGINPWVFETQYMQNPKPMQGLLYERKFIEYESLPTDRSAKKCCYVDSADTGSDYLCAIAYLDRADGIYVTDVIYTQKSMEYTEPELARMLERNDTRYCTVESNNGGRTYMRNVKRIYNENGNAKCTFIGHTQTGNKEQRLFVRSNEVNNIVYFPKGWNRKWPDFYNAITGYRKEGRNAHDDAPDALTGCVERRGKYSSDDSSLFQDFL